MARKRKTRGQKLLAKELHDEKKMLMARRRRASSAQKKQIDLKVRKYNKMLAVIVRCFKP